MADARAGKAGKLAIAVSALIIGCMLCFAQAYASDQSSAEPNAGSSPTSASGAHALSAVALAAEDARLFAASPTVSPSKVQLSVGEQCQLDAEYTSLDTLGEQVLWLSDDESVASVDQSGVITAKAKGSTIVTVKTRDTSKVLGTVSVTVVDRAGGGAVAYPDDIFADTDNAGRYGYTKWASPTRSYLHVVSGGKLERVEYLNGDLIVELVSSDWDGIESRKIIPSSTYKPSDAPSAAVDHLWGGFYSGADFNFVVTGRDNPGEDDSRVVFRVTKYTKEWERIGEAEVSGANTTRPFDAGSCDMVEEDGKLYVRTCHEMYTSSDDGLNHQANVQLVIDEQSMEVIDRYTSVWNQDNGGGYVSHSFNQFLATLDGSVYGLDHGDAYPRAVTIKKLYGDYANVFPIVSGQKGDNATGVSVGGFDSSSTSNSLISVGNVIDQSRYESVGADVYQEARNVWCAVTTPSLETELRMLTDYDALGSESAGTPFLVKMSDDRFLVMWGIQSAASTPWGTTSWELNGKVGYQLVDGLGEPIGSGGTVDAVLSDCQPVAVNDTVVWYAGIGNCPSFYILDTQSGALIMMANLNGASVTVSEDAVYDGTPKEPKGSSVIVTLNGLALPETAYEVVGYSNNVNVGEKARVTVKGVGNYHGTASGTFTISPSNLAGASISFLDDEDEYVYDGRAKEPVPVVTMGERTLKEDSDYTVSYSDNVQPGDKATVTVTGQGNYTGIASKSFSITAAQSPDSDSSGSPNSGSASNSGSSGGSTSSGSGSSGSGSSGSGSSSSSGSGSSGSDPTASAQAMHRLYNPNSGEHFYTADEGERDAVAAAGWKYEGVGWTAPATSGTPVYRLYNKYGGEHHYCTDKGEHDALVAAGWLDEGIGWYSDDAKSVPLYREYNPNAFANNHNYTTDKAEHEWLLSLGWKDEGRAWYGVK